MSQMTIWITVTAFGSVLGTWSAIYVGKILPDRKAQEIAKDEHDEQASHLDAFLNGIEPIAGVTVGARPAAVRLESVETSMRKVADGQSLLERLMYEANGTAKSTLEKVNEILKHFAP